jgi:hypothetical protein
MNCPPQKLYPHGLAGAPQVFLTGGGLGMGDGFGRGEGLGEGLGEGSDEGLGEGFGEGRAEGRLFMGVVGEADGDGLGLAAV